MIAEPTSDGPGPPPAIARRPAVIGLALGLAAALLATLWWLAIPLGILAVLLSWRAAQAARGRDGRTIGLAVGGMTVGGAGVLLALASAIFSGGGDDPADLVVIDGIETSTPDAAHQPPLDLEPGARCTVDLDGLRAAGTITNHTVAAARYVLKVVWEDSGETLAEATAILDPVAPGASVPFTVVSPATTGTAATTCRVAQIDRTKP
jgi:hypothetical protein